MDDMHEELGKLPAHNILIWSPQSHFKRFDTLKFQISEHIHNFTSQLSITRLKIQESMKKLILLMAFITYNVFLFAQYNPYEIQKELANTITSSELKDHLTIIASDEFEGRETGTEGQRKAADYIANQFKSMGLPAIGEENSYFQSIAFTRERWDDMNLNINKKRFKHQWEYYAYPNTNSDKNVKTKKVLFLGYGIDDEKYSDYKGINVKDKVLLIYDGEPTSKEGISHLTGTTETTPWSSNWRKKAKTAFDKGAAGIMIIDNNFKKNLQDFNKFLLTSGMRYGAGEFPEDNYTNNLFISTEIAKEIMGKNYNKVIEARDEIKASGKPQSQKLKARVELTQKKAVRQILGSNVLGFIEGTDEKLKNEIVVVTAHYDHLGKKGESIFNGADDNGSGTSSVLEVAEALAEAKAKGIGPRRSVLCMLVSGEEKGLLGSKYYAEFPIFPLENTVANVNVDMVGRVDKRHEDNPNYIYVIGSDRLSTDLHKINEAANKNFTNLELDYKYNDPKDPNRYYYRSDHYNFAEKGIPAIFYFSGTHVDYHKPSDTIEKINFEKMEKIAKLVFHTTWELANRDERIKVDVVGKN